MRLTCALIAMFALPLAAWGGLLPDDGVSAQEVAAALKDAGYPADAVNGGSGDPVIRSSTGNLLFTVNLFQCGQRLRCASAQFTAPFRHKTLTQAMIGVWNRERRFGRAFLDSHGTAWLAMDVEASRGVTTEALKADIERWIGVLSAFDTFAAR